MVSRAGPSSRPGPAAERQRTTLPPDWTRTACFTPPPGALPGAPLAGRLELATTPMTVDARPPGSLARYPWNRPGVLDFLAAFDPPGAPPLRVLDATLFPGLPLDLVITGGGDVIPADRGPIRLPPARRTRSFWDMIAGPGQAWDRGGGWSRAAFPFSLVQSCEGQAWLGLAAFDYRDHEITPLRVQVSSVAGGGFLFGDAAVEVTGWAQVPVRLSRTQADPAPLAAEFAAERASLAAPASLAALGTGFARARDILDARHTLALAVLDGGTLYMDPVDTPFGPHPFPRDLRAGVWSVTKSLIPGLAALRMAQKYGPGILDLPLIGPFVEGREFTFASAEARARWQGVTIRHALDMTTGMGATGYDTNWDATNLDTYRWAYSPVLADRIRACLGVSPNPEVPGPGRRMTYIDQDMWLAALAMERFLQAREGPAATLLDLLRREVYDPIGARHFAAGTGHTDSGAPGFPMAAWGALPTIDILARAGALVATGGRAPDGAQILHPDLVASLFSEPSYGLAFRRHAGPGFVVPAMSGAGGNMVLPLPNGMVIVLLGRDSFGHEVDEAALSALVAAARALRPF